MRSSSNPAFRNLPGQGGYAGFDDRVGGAAGGAAAYRQTTQPAGFDRSTTTDRPLTIDDVVAKTAITAGVALVAGVLTALSGMYWLALPGFLVGLVVSLIIIFKQSSNPALVITYSVAEGLALGGITGYLESSSSSMAGIGFQAIIGTFGVFVGMLVVYKTGAIKVTPRLTKMVIGAMFGVVGLMLINFVVGFFSPGGIGIRSGGPLAILFSIVVIGIAAFILLLDFDQADQAIRAGAPARTAWYIAFGLMTTLVWLYLEILRLLSYLRQD
ncbi:MAG TPA: Bax inhibitor-1/YccA family protein [Pseudonocardia sp.]|uniref:Bax inhibitor-1/YccA family protein n=1 Tax=Pseudonocardia sp. TaxID=60912 RepID=UPI002C8657BD|nr:Bax inhibitor-1/YccA family protein [Pseudonocardia sp.]HTF47292.1 Bax inhibitor-1/YccA family protein [Pseudonocardia sp.]